MDDTIDYDCDSEITSEEEDEDELTKIIPPQGIANIKQNNQMLLLRMQPATFSQN